MSGSYGKSSVTLYEIAKMFLKGAVYFSFPPVMHESSGCSACSPSTWYYQLFNFSGWVNDKFSWFQFSSSWWMIMLHIFSWAYWPFIHLLLIICSNLLYFRNWIIFYWLLKSLKTRPLSVLCIPNISQSVTFLFFFLT